MLTGRILFFEEGFIWGDSMKPSTDDALETNESILIYVAVC